MEYTSNQQKAINHWEGNLQIIACAGSGKTDVITRRIAKLVSMGVKTSSIVAFTFTENAAEEMKFRVRKHLQELRPEDPEIGDMYIGTIHSFCFELLKEFQPQYRTFDVLEEHQRVLFLSNYTNYNLIGIGTICNDKSRYQKITRFCQNIDIIREEMIDPLDLPKDLWKCYQKYIELIHEEKFLDFSGMMAEFLRFLENDEEFASKIRARFKHIIVDEYQDINPIQEKIIQLIAGEQGNVCVVGDDDQCIYQWRGTNVNNLLTFEKRYDDVKSIEITKNFRSSKIIIDGARKLIEQNENRLPKKIRAWEKAKTQYEPGDIYTVYFSKPQEEIDFILDKIEHLRGTQFINNKGETFALDYRDMAIFFRSVKISADKYIKAFKKRGIPFIVKGGGKLFEQDEVLLAVKSLAYLAEYKYNRKKVTPQMLKKHYNECFGNNGNVELFLANIEQLKHSEDLEGYISLQGVYHKILGYMSSPEFVFTETQLYNLGMLSQAITDFEAIYKTIKLSKIKYFLGFIHGYAKWNYEEGGAEDPTKVNAIKIMTVHRAKGLEFPIVFVPELHDGLFPMQPKKSKWLVPEELFDKNRYEGSIEDERRLFYVAITRSQKYLFLSANGGNSTRKNRPSRFFNEFPKNYVLSTPLPDPTKREQLDLSQASPLKRFATSYSDLRYFDRCPYDYKLRFIFGFNPEIAIALGYGKSVHNILNIIHSKYRTDPPSPEKLREIVDENFFLRYCTKESIERFKLSAYKIVENYLAKFSDEFNLILETEKSFEFALKNSLISGQIDLIKKYDEEGGLEAIEIVDFKEHNNAEIATDYKKQLRLYAIASKRALGIDTKKATVHHLDEGTREEVDIGEKVLWEVKENTKDTITKIVNRKFPKHPSDKRCEFCDWKHFCSKKG
ncbi:MAG: ATP-dependent DNA helicase [Asgard group archaeon]|nr:ATP-dependent DNA helicase [Asgard group archaeon]